MKHAPVPAYLILVLAISSCFIFLYLTSIIIVNLIFLGVQVLTAADTMWMFTDCCCGLSGFKIYSLS